MSSHATTLRTIADEARSLLDRVSRLEPFALRVPMLVAAGPSFDAQIAIERHLRAGQHALAERIRRFLTWLDSPPGQASSPASVQQRFVLLRLGFNVAITHLDLFAEAMSQRSEAETGVFLAGLDEVARDALALPGHFESPPVICYLARGPGAAIRRARARLPGGGANPVAIIRLPRERMIGSGVASSLAHEVGHQGAALLDLVPSLRAAMAQRGGEGAASQVWQRWARWISEIIADFWAIARVGVTSTLGLISVVSLPRAFVVRDNGDDPHPTPWLRVKLSCAIGAALYPHPQWERIAQQWQACYPLDDLPHERRAPIAAMERGIPALVSLLIEHRPASLRGKTLAEALASPARTPDRLAALWAAWRARPRDIRAASPSLAFAVTGQARADGAITPQAEGALLADLLRHHALRSTLDRTAVCVARPHRNSQSAGVIPTAVHAVS